MMRRFPALALILPVIALAYAAAPAGPFQFDDYNVIVDNPQVHSLAAWWQSLPGLRMGLKLSYALDWTLWSSATGFHIVNMLLHLFNATLLWHWLREILPASLPQRAGTASITVLLWGLHPAQTEAVTYVAGRSMSLMATFYLAALLMHARRDRHHPGWTTGFALLALLVRETAWTLPLALLLTEHLRGAPWRAALRGIAPVIAVTLAAALFFLLEPHYSRMLAFSLALRDLHAQFFAQLAGWHYLLATALFRLTPNIDPDIVAIATLTPEGLATALVSGALTVAAAVLAWQRRITGFALLWTFLHLLPTNSVFPRLDIASDRHLYLALIGPALLAGLLLPALPAPRLAATLLAVLLLAATLLRNQDYRSELALWTRTAEQSPHKARVWNNLGQAAAAAGNPVLARQAYLRALQLAPDDNRTRLNLYFLDEDHPPGR